MKCGLFGSCDYPGKSQDTGDLRSCRAGPACPPYAFGSEFPGKYQDSRSGSGFDGGDIPSVEFVQVTIVNPNTVMQDLILSIFVKVTEIQQLRVVTDVKSDRIPINAVRQLVAIEDVVNEKSQQINIRREVEIPEEKPPAQKILQIFSSTVEITRADILDGKIILEGVLVLQIIYVAAEEDQPVHHAHVEIPFTSFVDMPGAYPGMNVLVRPSRICHCPVLACGSDSSS